MEQQSAEESFLCVDMEGLVFVIPLLEVNEIMACDEGRVDAESHYRFDSCEELPLLNFHANQMLEEKQLVVVLSAKGKRFGLVVDRVEGVVNIEAAKQFPLPALVQDASNHYLGGVCYHEGKLCYLMDTQQLCDYIV